MENSWAIYGNSCQRKNTNFYELTTNLSQIYHEPLGRRPQGPKAIKFM